MLTALTVKEEIPKTAFKRVLFKLKSAPIKAEIVSVEGISVVNIKYTTYGNKIPWKKLGKIIGPQRSSLICVKSLLLPYNEGFNRYTSSTLNVRLAENAALDYLKKSKHDPNLVTVGLYDITGRHSDLVKHLLPYSNNIKIITENISLYMELASGILEEYGAPINVRKNIGQLYDCSIVIAPGKIKRSMPIREDTPVYTGYRPAVIQSGIVKYDFNITLPDVYKPLKPEGLTDTYFASVLYEKERQYSLGTLVPY